MRGFHKRRNGLLAGLGVDTALAAPFPAARCEKAPTPRPELAAGMFDVVGLLACYATVATVTARPQVALAAVANSREGGQSAIIDPPIIAKCPTPLEFAGIDTSGSTMPAGQALLRHPARPAH